MSKRDEYQDILKWVRASSKDEFLRASYDATHAMQSAVAYRLNATVKSPEFASLAKDLRVGVNNAMSHHGALVWLLIEKGVIQEDEYRAAQLMFERQEAELNARQTRREFNLPDNVHFG